VLQADTRKPDDVDSDGEDHCADEARYLVTSLASRERQIIGLRGI
jgi:hypothetical protein